MFLLSADSKHSCLSGWADMGALLTRHCSRVHTHCVLPLQNQNNNVQTVIVQQSTQLELLLQNLIKLLVSLKR